MKRVVLGAVCAVLMVAATTVSTPVGAAGTGSISGAVSSDVGGAPLGGIEVCAFSNVAGDCTSTAVDGTYLLPSLPPGTFEVRFTDQAESYVSESYDDILDLNTPTPVDVLDGQVTSGINASLALAGSVSGTVIDGVGSPIASIQVCATGPAGNCGTTIADGTYSVGGLLPGDYTVQFLTFGANYVEEYYDDAGQLADADVVSVTAGATTTGVDAELAEGATISGSVTDGVNPIEASVCAEAGASLRCATTDSSGNYTIEGLAGGSYNVSFSDFDGLYGLEYFDDAFDSVSATPVQTSVATPAFGVDAVLELLTSISGTVTDGVNPISGIVVCAAEAPVFRCAQTNGSGDYSIEGLRAGTYVVSFEDFGALYGFEYYDDVSDIGAATPVSPTANNPAVDVDAVLEMGASISGTVTDGVNALPGIRVCANNDMGGNCALTNGTGGYTVGGLVDDSYHVYFADDSQTYVNEYYDDELAYEDAMLVATSSASPATDIDAQLAMGASIAGTVTDEAGAPIGVSVCAFAVLLPVGGCTDTAIDGTWLIGGLVDDAYTVEYTDGLNVYVGEYHDDALTWSNATEVVIDGSDVTGLTAELVIGGKIAGTITGSDGSALDGAWVCALPEGDPYSASYCGPTDSDGAYGAFMPALPDGTYVVQAFDFNGLYRSEYHGGALQPEFATAVTVVGPTTTSGIDIELDLIAELGDAFHLLPFGCSALFSGPLASGDIATTNTEFCGIPGEATAAQVIVTAHDPQAFGNLRISPSGVAPLGGIVNFAANGLTNSNSAAVPLGTNGELDVSANSSSAGTLVNGAEVQVLGWYGPDQGSGLEYVPITPCAFVDTRNDATPPTGDFVGPISAFETVTPAIAGTVPATQGVDAADCGVPTDATAALVNFVLIGATDDVALREVSTFATIVNNTAVTPPMNNSAAVPVPISGDGTIVVEQVGSGDAHLRAVVLGYYQPNSGDGLEHRSLTPCAAFDTRTGTGTFAGKRDGGETTTFDVTGTFASAQGGGNTDCGVPSDAVAVEINLVAIAPDRFGNLRASAAGIAPSGGVLNFGSLSPAMNNSNTVVVPVAGGEIDVNVNAGGGGVGQATVHVRGVITGYYGAPPPG